MEALRACQDDLEAMQLALDYAAGHKGESVEYALNTQKLMVVWDRLRAVDRGDVNPVCVDSPDPNDLVAWFDLGEGIQAAVDMYAIREPNGRPIVGFAYDGTHALMIGREDCPIMSAIVAWRPIRRRCFHKTVRDAWPIDRSALAASLDTSPR